MNILPVVVLYNVDFGATNVYRSLLAHFPEQRILLYENSPEPLNAKYESALIAYRHDPLNGGVSAAYNEGAHEAALCGGIDALLLLDEDTQFPHDYLSVLLAQAEAHPDIDLFVPQVIYGTNLPFSPTRRNLCLQRGAMLTEGIYSLRQYLPVNSGACIRLQAFQKAGSYNPAIRLDFADFDFFSRLAEISDRFYLIDCVARQSFSNEEHRQEHLFRRFQFYVEGAREARQNKLISKMVAVDIWRHTLALTLRTRSPRFLTYLIQNI